MSPTAKIPLFLQCKQKSLRKSEKRRIFYTFGIKCRLFHVLQLVCEGHLRSFTGKTYTRLWARLTCACGIHLFVLWNTLICELPTQLPTILSVLTISCPYSLISLLRCNTIFYLLLIFYSLIPSISKKICTFVFQFSDVWKLWKPTVWC